MLLHYQLSITLSVVITLLVVTWYKCCTRCDLGIIEDTKHIVMQCPYNVDARKCMYNDIDNIGSDEINNLMKDAGCV